MLRQVEPTPGDDGEQPSKGRRLTPELRARLEALGVHTASSAPRKVDADDKEPVRLDLKPPAIAERPFESHAVEAQDATLRERVGGVERETPFGTFLYVERRYPLTALHGNTPLHAALDHPVPLRAHEAKPGTDTSAEPARLCAEDAVFIDTETTGLSGGTGTVAFLVGTGAVESDDAGASGAFVVRQYCMRDYPEEAALLHALMEDVGDAPLVSFNGRCFDWPLLLTRWSMHRMRPAARAHLDLLPAARRIWARTLHSHSLGALERHVLELGRGDDLPGWRIPSAYFDFLRSGDSSAIAFAFRHNEIDVVSMIVLMARIGKTLQDPLGRVARPGDQLGTARLLLDLGERDRARRCLEAGLRDADGEEALPLARLLGRLCRQSGDVDGALKHWTSVAVSGAMFDPDAYEHVAKIYEHRLGDFDEALRWTTEALTKVDAGSRAEDALRHRADRLRRRIARRDG